MERTKHHAVDQAEDEPRNAQPVWQAGLTQSRARVSICVVPQFDGTTELADPELRDHAAALSPLD